MRCERFLEDRYAELAGFYALWVGLCVARGTLWAPWLSCRDATGCENRSVVGLVIRAERV
jgi:hypothetical protein